MRRALGLVGLATLLFLLLFLAWLPEIFDRYLNVLAKPGPYLASPLSLELLAQGPVVDLHADSLLVERDLLVRNEHGHVDLPRLEEGRVTLQVFSIVTQTPAGMNFERTDGDRFDLLTLAVVAQRWPWRTWFSRLDRALYQAEKFDSWIARSAGALYRVDDSEQVRTLRKAGVGGLLALEGMQPLEGDLANLERLYEAGIRMMAPTHFFDNRIAGSSAGVEKHGLTPLGKRAVDRMEELGIVVDLAHASPRTIDDVLDRARKPVVVSHTGVQATCPGPRNLSDHAIRRVAENGGVIGIGYFAGAVCGRSPAVIAKAMRHVRDLVGAEHLALGSDYDGGTTVDFDTSGLALIVDALLAEGFTHAEIRLTLGASAIRVLSESLRPLPARMP